MRSSDFFLVIRDVHDLFLERFSMIVELEKRTTPHSKSTAEEGKDDKCNHQNSPGQAT